MEKKKRQKDGSYELVDEEVSRFMRERDTCVSVPSYYGRVPSFEYIQALEESYVFSISYDELEEIFLTHLEFNYNARVLTVKYLVDWALQLYGIRRLTATERYKALWERDKELFDLVPLKYLASYLGVSEKTVSRLKRKGGIW